MTSTPSRWCVARAQPSTVSKIVVHLGRTVAELPHYLKTRRHKRRVGVVSAPLVLCCLFVTIDMAAPRRRSIHST